MTPIRKGSNPVKIPFAIKSSDRTFAAWANETRTAIQQLEARMPTAPVGRAASGGGGTKPAFWTSISRIPDSENYQVTVTQGYLIYQNATSTDSEDGVTGWISPKINGVDMEDAEVEPIPLPNVESWVYLRVKTDADGAPKFDGESVTIEAFTSKQTSIHHVRPSPDGGEEEGDYFFLLLQTEGNGGTPEAPRAVRRLTGNIELRNQLIEIENIGGEIELYKGYDPGPDDKHKLKTLKQLEGGGVRIIKSEVDDESDTVDFRDVKQGDQGQIHVVERSDSVIVEGNGIGGTFQNAYNAELQIYDGLVASIGLPSLETFTGLIQIVDGCGTIVHKIDVQKGLVITYQQTAITP